jgi:hypothetical protein
MAIPGILPINIGLPNEAANSDSLFSAFTKTKDNFSNLFACSSPFSTFTGNGVHLTANATAGTLDITNTGVLSLTAGTNITLSGSNGNITISSSGGNNGYGGTVTSVGISTTTLNVSGSPIVSNGVINVNLPTISGVSGLYTYPEVRVDQYGRITQIANGASLGTVTSVGITPGTGIQVTNSPITNSGNITVTNTGVTRLAAGVGISLSGSNGNVTISTLPVAAVTSINVTSSSLVSTGGPVTSSGTINIELPTNISVSGNIQAANLISQTSTIANTVVYSGAENLSNGASVSLSSTASYFTTSGASTATLSGTATNGLIKTFMMVDYNGNMVITVGNAGWKASGSGTITFNNTGDGCTLQYVNNKWYCIGQNGVVFG